MLVTLSSASPCLLTLVQQSKSLPSVWLQLGTACGVNQLKSKLDKGDDVGWRNTSLGIRMSAIGRVLPPLNTGLQTCGVPGASAALESLGSSHG